jgi:hypothetical protein
MVWSSPNARDDRGKRSSVTTVNANVVFLYMHHSNKDASKFLTLACESMSQNIQPLSNIVHLFYFIPISNVRCSKCSFHGEVARPGDILRVWEHGSECVNLNFIPTRLAFVMHHKDVPCKDITD